MSKDKISRRDFVKKVARDSFFLFSISSIPDFVLAVEGTNSNPSDQSSNNTQNNPDSSLPAWFLENRVQAHVRYTLKMMKNNPEFRKNGNKILKDLGANVITRHFKSADEGAWWPTKHGKEEPLAKELSPNLAKEIIDDAHKLGLRIIAYYRHMEDKYIAKEHPDWLCRNWRGKKIHTLSRRGYHLCFNSPYREIVKGRLIELAKLGVDGLYFDATHMPIYGCWCNYCKERFRKEYNMEPPNKPDPQDVVWAKYYVEFNNRTVEEAFIEWKKAVKQINPDVVFIISLHLYPTLLDHHLSSRLMTIADSVKSEFNIPARKYASGKKDFLFKIPKGYNLDDRVRLILGYTLIRDGAYGRPAHIWIPEAIDISTLKKTSSLIISGGNISNINIWESFLKNKKVKFLLEGFKLNRKLKSLINFEALVPYGEIGVLFSEQSRNSYIPDYEQAFKKVIYPVYKAFEYTYFNKIPVRIITDETLENIDKNIKYIFVPTIKGLNYYYVEILDKFEKNGGKIFHNLKEFMVFINKYKPNIIIESNFDIYASFFIEKNTNSTYIFFANLDQINKLSNLSWKTLRKERTKILKYNVQSNILKKSKFKSKLRIKINSKFELYDILGNVGLKRISINSYEVVNFQEFSVLKFVKV